MLLLMGLLPLYIRIYSVRHFQYIAMCFMAFTSLYFQLKMHYRSLV